MTCCWSKCAKTRPATTLTNRTLEKPLPLDALRKPEEQDMSQQPILTRYKTRRRRIDWFYVVTIGATALGLGLIFWAQIL
jgi:hypothetical protein